MGGVIGLIELCGGLGADIYGVVGGNLGVTGGILGNVYPVGPGGRG
jgi:hypothetical protein